MQAWLTRSEAGEQSWLSVRRALPESQFRGPGLTPERAGDLPRLHMLSARRARLRSAASTALVGIPRPSPLSARQCERPSPYQIPGIAVRADRLSRTFLPGLAPESFRPSAGLLHENISRREAASRSSLAGAAPRPPRILAA